MNLISKCAFIGGLVLLAQVALADKSENIEVCFTANYTFTDNTYIPQRYIVKLSNGESTQVLLPTPSAYQGWFGMHSSSLPNILSVASESMSSVRCQTDITTPGPYVNIVVEYGSGTIPLNCSITTSQTSSPCQGHNVG